MCLRKHLEEIVQFFCFCFGRAAVLFTARPLVLVVTAVAHLSPRGPCVAIERYLRAVDVP